MFERQVQHYLILAVLLTGVVALLDEAALAGQLLGITTGVWLVLAIAIPILHHVYTWFVWRSELYHALISRTFGKERGFTYFAVGFFILFLSRPISIIVLAISNRNTVALNPAISFALAALLLLPSLYLFYSVQRYFGIERALGIDHFDSSYRTTPFVKEGIFRFTNNGMYTFGFLALWLPGLLLFSKAALLAALFNHLYIWVHYYCTELPDIRHIYGGE